VLKINACSLVTLRFSIPLPNITDYTNNGIGLDKPIHKKKNAKKTILTSNIQKDYS